MSNIRYNWLRKRGYKTISGTNYRDTDFGDIWSELLMSNGKKIKNVKVNMPDWREVKRIEETKG